MKRLLYYLGLLLLAISGGRPDDGFEPLSHYPGTPRFVPPWRLGTLAPSDPDSWYFREEEDEDQLSGSYWYCQYGLGRRFSRGDVKKPRATRE